MRCHFMGPFVVLLVLTGVARAAEIEGRLKSVDPAKNTILLTVKDRDRTFTITGDTKIVVHDVATYVVKDRLKDPVFMRKGLTVRLMLGKPGGKEVVTELAVYTGRKG